jgi:hypothetical protein
LLAVEISLFSMRYRRRYAQRWQRQLQQFLDTLPLEDRSHPALKRLEAQLAWPFEVRAAQEYAQAAGIAWQPIDGGELSRWHLARYSSELLTFENLRNLLLTKKGDFRKEITLEYRRARLALTEPEHFGGLIDRLRQDKLMLKREKLLARRLRSLTVAGLRIVYLGGWSHLLTGEGWPTLAQQLHDLQPQKILLDEADGAWGNDKEID